jgi:hypothetical protein
MYDVLLGFNYATVRGMEETKKNEGAAMAYALYYMVNPNCRFEYMVKSQAWINSMSMYMMAFVLYNEKMIKHTTFPQEVLANYLQEHKRNPNTVLHRFFQKLVLVRDMKLPFAAPVSVDAQNMELTKRDLVTRTVLQRRQQQDPAADPNADSPEVANSATLIPYYSFNIFNAPLLLGMRASTFVMGRTSLANNPNVCIFNLEFQKGDATGDNSPHTASVFAIEGPVMYGVSEAKPLRQLPFMNTLPRLTNAYVVSLAATTNMEPQEDRIFAAKTAKYRKYTVEAAATPNKFRLTEITDAGRTL